MAKAVILLLTFAQLLFLRAIVASSPKTLENGNKLFQLSHGGRHCPKDKEFDPVHQVRCGVNVVYQVPLNPRAILLLVHGRTRSALSYFDRSEGCHLCYGLPEDRRQTLEGLRRGYATIVIQSAKYESWDIWPPQDSKDVLNVRTIMKEWVEEQCLQGLPLAVLGNSAGGNFSTMVVDVLGIKSLALMNAPGEHSAIMRADASFPPTFFSYMPKDNGPSGFARPIEQNYNILKNKGVRVRILASQELSIHPSFFNKRIPCLSCETSRRMVQALQRHGCLNARHFLTRNPKDDLSWIVAIRDTGALPDCSPGQLCLEEHVKEELALAYAEHAITSLHNQQIFDWFDSTLFAPILTQMNSHIGT